MNEPLPRAPSRRVATARGRLCADGLIAGRAAELHTTRRWQGAMARAALRLYALGDPCSDLRIPIAFALVEIYGDALPDEELAEMIEVMLPLELASLGLPRR